MSDILQTSRTADSSTSDPELPGPCLQDVKFGAKVIIIDGINIANAYNQLILKRPEYSRFTYEGLIPIFQFFTRLDFHVTIAMPRNVLARHPLPLLHLQGDLRPFYLAFQSVSVFDDLPEK